MRSTNEASSHPDCTRGFEGDEFRGRKRTVGCNESLKRALYFSGVLFICLIVIAGLTQRQDEHVSDLLPTPKVSCRPDDKSKNNLKIGTWCKDHLSGSTGVCNSRAYPYPGYG
jgi:hypothetical protein